jgi:membrane protease YdiL (CAAX protease family)
VKEANDVAAERKGTHVATWVGLAIALVGFPVLSYAVPARLGPVAQTLVREAICWTLAALVLVILVRWERCPLRSIGLRRPGWRSILLGLLGFLLLSIVYGVATLLQARLNLPGSGRGMAQLLVLPVWLRVLLVVRAGVVEEILYRGYPIERIAWLSGSRWAGALVPLAIFSLAHVPFWGVAYLLVVLPAAVVLTCLYLWKRDLTVNMVAHFLADCIGIVVVPLVSALLA